MAAPLAHLFGGAYDGASVLVTGHTGFKGSWLALWLAEMGATVTGLALEPEHARDHFNTAGLGGLLASSRIGDIRDYDTVLAAVQAARPRYVFHLAAQALVRYGYAEPLETFASNVMGTAHVLEACRHVDSVEAVVVITSDKCYENLERREPYAETDRLGGRDPYSASKACAEIVTGSYRLSFFGEGARVASVRAGNVIGGGDWSDDRIVCDFFRAREAGDALGVRNPASVRPWQHVLEPLGGYLRLGALLAAPGGERFADAYNLGPDASGQTTVAELADLLVETAGGAWEATPQEGAPHEAGLLALDAGKAKRELGWAPVLDIAETVGFTAEHYVEAGGGADVRALSVSQIARFADIAAERGITYLAEAVS